MEYGEDPGQALVSTFFISGGVGSSSSSRGRFFDAEGGSTSAVGLASAWSAGAAAARGSSVFTGFGAVSLAFGEWVGDWVEA